MQLHICIHTCFVYIYIIDGADGSLQELIDSYGFICLTHAWQTYLEFLEMVWCNMQSYAVQI